MKTERIAAYGGMAVRVMDTAVRRRARTWLPMRIRLHPGYTVLIRLVDKGYSRKWGLHRAWWEESTRTIFIQEAVERTMLDSLGHELLHAAADFSYRTSRVAHSRSSRQRRRWLSKLTAPTGREGE